MAIRPPVCLCVFPPERYRPSRLPATRSDRVDAGPQTGELGISISFMIANQSLVASIPGSGGDAVDYQRRIHQHHPHGVPRFSHRRISQRTSAWGGHHRLTGGPKRASLDCVPSRRSSTRSEARFNFQIAIDIGLLEYPSKRHPCARQKISVVVESMNVDFVFSKISHWVALRGPFRLPMPNCVRRASGASRGRLASAVRPLCLISAYQYPDGPWENRRCGRSCMALESR